MKPSGVKDVNPAVPRHDAPPPPGPVCTSAPLVAACGVEPASKLDVPTEPVTTVLSPFGRPGLQNVNGLHCDTEPIDNGNGTTTSIACPYEQQRHNLDANGSALSSGRLFSAGQPVAFTSSVKCGVWLLGTDSSGVEVFVSTADGTVRSHGAVHSGYPLTVLPGTLAAPVELRQ